MPSDQALTAWLDLYGHDAGICRATVGTKDYLYVRLGWKGRTPTFSVSLQVDNYESEEAAYVHARELRDKVFRELYSSGKISLYRKRTRPIRTRKNKTGVPGMTLQRTTAKDGCGQHYTWKVNWKEAGRQQGRSFAWSSYATGDDDGSWPSFSAAAKCRMEADLRTFGCSEIDPGEDALKHKYHAAMDNYFGMVTKRPNANLQKGHGA